MARRVFRTKRERKEFFRRLYEDLLRRHRYLMLVDALGMRAKLVERVRRMAEDLNYVIKGGKNGVLLKAIENVYSSEVAARLKPHITGQNLFVFTNEDPVSLALKLTEVEESFPASPGQIAPEDIVVPAGNTGIPPGPIIGLFSALNIPTKIVGGTIHVMRDVVVVKKGEKISLDVVNLLSKLGIEPIKKRVRVKLAYDFKDHVLIPEELLVPNLEELKSNVEECASRAFRLSIGIGYVTDKTAQAIISLAAMRARALALRARFVTDRNLPEMLQLAARIASELSRRVEAAGS